MWTADYLNKGMSTCCDKVISCGGYTHCQSDRSIERHALWHARYGNVVDLSRTRERDYGRSRTVERSWTTPAKGLAGTAPRDAPLRINEH
ncbi:hypothetical protein TNCV_867111 [Trichonephila clavipes]|nr:hypothetical protein TNCV_867111 [Trichonephila clavipes]